MSRHWSKLVHATVALVLLAMSILLWPSLAASSAHAAACTSGNNFVCVSNTPTVALTLNGKDQTVGYTLNFSLKANTTTWNVTISSTQFTTGGAVAHTLPTTASSVTNVCQGSPCAAFPTNTITYPFTMTAGTSTKLCNATANGMGTFSAAATINVTVPGDAYAGTYTSTITLAVVTGSP